MNSPPDPKGSFEVDTVMAMRSTVSVPCVRSQCCELFAVNIDRVHRLDCQGFELGIKRIDKVAISVCLDLVTDEF